MIDTVVPFLEASVRTATPLALAALGETIVERAGVINIGLEGAIIAGAFGAVAAAGTFGVGGAFVSGMAAGMLTSAIVAFFVVTIRADQIVVGTAVTLLALGLTGVLYRRLFGLMGAALSIPPVGSVAVPVLASIPFLGRAFFVQPVITYVAYLLTPAVGWWLSRTQMGLALRSVGENPDAATAAGISPARIRWFALLAGGLLGGLSGAALVVVQTGTFAEGMSAGRGFIAIAIVALGRWSPVRVAAASLLFGAATALQFAFQALGWALPYQLFLAFPYIVTIAALIRIRGRATPPAALGRR